MRVERKVIVVVGDYDGWNFNVNEGYATIAPIVHIYGSCIFVIDFTTQNSLRTLWNRCNERGGEISNRLQQVGAANSCEMELADGIEI